MVTEEYLDITKSVLISSPAGSGKTEKLARRYIALLESGSAVERILAITFTEKAAAEMKERIGSVLAQEKPELFLEIRKKIPRMRISTIHAFCLKLLKRFCLDLGVDPSLEVMDGFSADILWSEAVYESLRQDGITGEKLFYELIKEKGVRGWSKLYGIIQELHGHRPSIERGLMEGGQEVNGRGQEPGKAMTGDHLKRILTLYERCLNRYRIKKLHKHAVDFNDLELMAFAAISKNPEWHNILFSFDEHTDHILVDEFQDTSFLQWKIIEKLTEEWRSGMGSKREAGIQPTIFLVGDDKQSIYSFRGADVSIFKNAQKILSRWLNDEYHFIEIRENYRSLPAIVDFVNTLFDRIMPRGLCDDWKIAYTPFMATRQGAGKVELFLIEGGNSTREARKHEASVMVDHMKALRRVYEVHDEGTIRPCTYGDMAVLLRSRTHLSAFEDALRNRGIPFVVVKGIGFYKTPEVSMLKDLLFFIIDPLDDYSLFNVLRSPIFSMDVSTISTVMKGRVSSEPLHGHLYTVLNSLHSPHRGPAQASLWEKALSDEEMKLSKCIKVLNQWLERGRTLPFSELLEEVLIGSGAWRCFHERQRYLNAKKFIKVVEDFEAQGLTGLEIREKVIRAAARTDEPKANINAEGMDAVRLMTIHASKGLQFPMVFVPSLDEEGAVRTGSPVALEVNGESIDIAYEEDSDLRKSIPLFQKQKEKGSEEEKRVFYVAVTRAMDYLWMSGVVRGGKYQGRLSYLKDAFKIGAVSDSPEKECLTVKSIPGAESVRASARPPTPEPHHVLSRLPGPDEIVFTEPIDKDYHPRFTWLDVTEEIEPVRRKHGDDWVVLGRVFHRLFEMLSKGITTLEGVKEKAGEILRSEMLPETATAAMHDTVMSHIKRLSKSGYLEEIVLPRKNAFSELPFILQREDKIYRGRVDRVIISDVAALLYDYKTYPVSEREMPELMQRYAFQMSVYKSAVETLFSLKTEAYLFFTYEPKLVKV